VRTLLNPVLIEAKEDNEFSKFDEDNYSEEDNKPLNKGSDNTLEKLKPIKMNSSSSISTLDNARNNLLNNNEDETIEKEDKIIEKQSSSGCIRKQTSSENLKKSNNCNEENTSGNEKKDFIYIKSLSQDNISCNNVKDVDKIRALRRSLTDADINNENKIKRINFSSSSNIRNINNNDNIKEEDNETVIKKEFKCINHILEPSSINRSMELFLSKHKKKQSRNAKYEIENVSYINVSRKKLDHIIFTSDNCSEVRRIDISGNSLMNLPPNIGIFDKLVELNVSDNKLKTIPTEIGFLKSLNILNLNNNNIETLPFHRRIKKS